MLSSTVPSSSTRYQVATDIGAPLGLSTATTAGLGRANSSATSAGSGALGMGVLLGRWGRSRPGSGESEVTRSCDPSSWATSAYQRRPPPGSGDGGRVAQRAVAVRRGCRGAAGVGDERRPAVRRPGDAGALEPVLLAPWPGRRRARRAGRGRRTAVTRAPRASQVPGVPRSTSPRSAQASPSSLRSRRVVIRSSWPGTSSGWQHSHIHQPSSSTSTTGSLTATVGAPGVDDGAAALGQAGWGVGVEGLDPPVLGTRCGTAEVEPPATVGSADQGRPLQGCRAERLAPDLRHGLERAPRRRSAPPRPRRRGRRRPGDAAGRRARPCRVVEHRAGGPGPVAGAAPGRRHDDVAVGGSAGGWRSPPRG